MNILSLDPMYSPLHNKIVNAFNAKNKYAILSSLGLSIYFKGFDIKYINKEISKLTADISDSDLNLVENDVNHYTALIKKVEKRTLNDKELIYMVKFCVFLRAFLTDNNINLVILHNDLRWQHSLAIKLCKELKIKYLVTEQGLFRPTTTIVDPSGVNANSDVKERFKKVIPYTKPKVDSRNSRNDLVIDGHNSYKSSFAFISYLLLSKIGVLFNTESKIVHKRHGFTEYFLRFFKTKNSNTKKKEVKFNKKVIFCPLQLELDTQLLIHSNFDNNQEVIDLISNAYEKLNISNEYVLVFKLHPNDTLNYIFPSYAQLIDCKIDDELLKSINLVISVNSTALLPVLETEIPVITLGRSIYDLDGVAIYSPKNDLASNIENSLFKPVNTSNRKSYIDFLKNEYSVFGAGYSYTDSELERVVIKNNSNFKEII